MTLHTGDCLEVMRTLPESSVDAVVTDPPYGLEFMGKAWDSPAKWDKRGLGPERGFKGKSRAPVSGFSAYQAGSPFQAWCEAWGREALRVTVPGGYLLAFGGTRTHHRLVCGLEDAGWIIRDELDWIYASGFPKGKANLKPAHEPIVLARKPGPLRMLGIDATRIPGQWTTWRRSDGTINPSAGFAEEYVGGDDRPDDVRNPEHSAGRWPANVVLTDPVFDGGVDGVVGGGETSSGSRNGEYASGSFSNGTGPVSRELIGDSGTYSRFFLIPKADRNDREPVLRGQLEPGMVGGRSRADGRQWDIPGSTLANGKPKRENTHATVKPIELMRHLVRLITPPGGTCLDPFLGSGTTAIACEMEGFAWIGIEKEPEYVAIVEARLNGVQKGLGLPA